jgi:hypothetical protein
MIDVDSVRNRLDLYEIGAKRHPFTGLQIPVVFPDLADLETRHDVLVARLNRELALIEQARSARRDDSQLCDRFEALLWEYEVVCDQMSELAPPSPPAWSEITLDLPSDTPLALPEGKWKHSGNGTIRAIFTREELEAALRSAAICYQVLPLELV